MKITRIRQAHRSHGPGEGDGVVELNQGDVIVERLAAELWMFDHLDDGP